MRRSGTRRPASRKASSSTLNSSSRIGAPVATGEVRCRHSVKGGLPERSLTCGHRNGGGALRPPRMASRLVVRPSAGPRPPTRSLRDSERREQERAHLKPLVDRLPPAPWGARQFPGRPDSALVAVLREEFLQSLDRPSCLAEDRAESSGGKVVVQWDDHCAVVLTVFRVATPGGDVIEAPAHKGLGNLRPGQPVRDSGTHATRTSIGAVITS